METVGRFEFNRKDLIGHGAFAVVFKGRHIEKRDVEVAIKCINKKNLAKSQSLLGKEIKILKELKHENIVGLLDYQEIGGCVYLVMEYCNGGDLAEYLQARRTLSEDTIRVFLQQIARAMWVLQSRGILHRDLKPQNILLCHPEGRRSSLNNTCVKIADFGFARHLQTNTMAVTLCGSPMYMAPEVIMSQNYDAKADLWSIGTVVYQCLTGKAPFYASTPQELRLFYEGNEKLLPSIPRETSSHLRHLLLGLLQRNHKERMAFDEFFTHPFLEPSPSPKSSPVPMIPSYPSSSSASGSASGSCCSGSSNSNQPSPQHSDEEMYRLQPNVLQPPTQRAPGARLKDTANQDSGTDSAHTEDFVMVPVQFPNEYTDEMGDVSPLEESLIYSSHSPRPERDPGLAGTTPPFTSLHSLTQPSSKTVELSGNPYHQAVPIPVPTQIHNYQRIEQNLQPAGLHGSTRARLCCAGSCNRLSPADAGRSGEAQTCHGSTLGSQRLQTGGHQTLQSSPRVRVTSVMSEQVCPLGTGTGSPAGSGRVQNSLSPMNNEQRKNTDPQIHKTSPNLQAHRTFPSPPDDLHWPKDNRKGTVKRSWSTGRLSDMLLRAAFGTQLLQGDICESPGSEKGMVDTAESPGYRDSAWFFGSPSLQRRPRMERPRRESDSEVMDATPQCSLEFHPPELPVDSLMEQAHTNALMDLRFALAFVHCVMEVASSKDPGLEDSSSPDMSFLQQSLVTDQISLLSSEWSHAEQLVLYMKSEEFLSSALHTAKEDIKAGRLLPSAAVKQVIRKLNELYKACVGYCRSLSHRLQGFLLDKQRLIDRFNGIAAEKLIYNHTVHMVQSAALDEMFHCSTTSIQRYIKGLLLMEGLCRIITEPQDINSIAKCKWCIERRLTALQRVPYP